MKIDWQIKRFGELTPYELYDIMRLRNEVFVVEQNCVFQDADNKDQTSWHLSGKNEKGELIAYCRILPAGISYEEASIGRVVSAKLARGTGAGKKLMEKAIIFIREQLGDGPIKIGAQLYLKRFYERFGFVQTSGIYLEDGIEHIEMKKLNGGL
jgi:ElaA protein